MVLPTSTNFETNFTAVLTNPTTQISHSRERYKDGNRANKHRCCISAHRLDPADSSVHNASVSAAHDRGGPTRPLFDSILATRKTDSCTRFARRAPQMSRPLSSSYFTPVRSRLLVFIHRMYLELPPRIIIQLCSSYPSACCSRLVSRLPSLSLAHPRRLSRSSRLPARYLCQRRRPTGLALDSTYLSSLSRLIACRPPEVLPIE
jgi:hypothetical protein